MRPPHGWDLRRLARFQERHGSLAVVHRLGTEPLPGHFPTAFGHPLQRESRFTHLGKLAFQWVKWQAHLPGRERQMILNIIQQFEDTQGTDGGG